ncbi:response regulator transcription factor [Schaedlerella arabinosiphila]|uniref:response regulator transcription factor n=1 Tax=Schaedlerella arabinosiphila TaxID=2044587 RepID=UPI0025580E96|nr:response regulator transcription factor [Schaedlerella arabinosiphila]MCI8766626.1 response regulator transcription factor [Ruminococcus sp.]
MKVLIVEDDEIIREGLKFALLQENYEVLSAAGVSEALEQIQNCRNIGFYLLDIMLPDGDGYQICREIRRNSSAPILFLTACEDEVHTVMALEQGADDYICKPFRIRELLARMKAILRRTSAQGGGLEQIVQVGKNQVNLQTGRVYSDKEEIILTAMEYKLLLIFLNHRGQTLSRSQILEGIWDEAGDFVNDNTLSVYMKRLRKKLGDTADGQIIRTVRGIGYRME